MKPFNTKLATLIAMGLFTAGPAFADQTVEVTPAENAAALGKEAQTDIEIINGIPVDPKLKAELMKAEQSLTVQELLDLSQKTLDDQQAQLDEQKKMDKSWMGNDPLGHLEGEMLGLVKDIDRSDTADSTQARGEDVVRKMDVLIAMLEKAASAASAAGGGGQGQGQGQGPANGNKPAEDSTLAAGPGGSGELNAAGTGNNRFEDLDPAQRDAILRAKQEQQGLPPEYSALLSEYYQRLANEKALETGDNEDAADDETSSSDD